MAEKILIFILCLSVTVVSTQNVTVEGNCSSSARSEPLEVWGIERDSLICRQWNKESCNETLPPQVGGTFMGAPESLTVEGVLIPDTNGDLTPQLIVTWKPPRSAAGFHNLKGFNMEVHKLTGTEWKEFICRVFDFSESNFTSEDHKLTFRKKFVQFPGGPEYLYRLDLYTLPRSLESVAKNSLFKLQPPIVGNNTANWTAAISYYVESVTAPATVTIHFSVAPSHYGFSSYYVQLMYKGKVKKNNALEQCYVDLYYNYNCQSQSHPKPPEGARTVTHSFYGIPAGRYAVKVQAYDPDQRDDNCLCYHGYHEENGVRKRDCDPCMATETGTFDVGQVDDDGDITTPSHSQSTSTKDQGITSTPDESNTTDDPSHTPGGPITSNEGMQSTVVTVVAALLGSALGLVLVGVVFVVLRRQRKFRSLPMMGRFNNKTIPPSSLLRKTVYLLYSSDHKEHVNVVTKFAIYLTNRCNCQVFFMPWFRGEIQNMGCYQWVISHIDRSDYVIIINSEAAFNLFDARNTNSSFQIDDQGPEVDMFSLAVTHVLTKSGHRDFYKKTILTYFEYTSDGFVLKDISPGIQYKVPTHLKELLCHIHEVDMYTVDRRKLEVESMDNLGSTEGRDLQEAITKAKHFEKSNREWFREKFHREDSAFDSISSPDLENDQDLGDSVSFSPYVNTGQPPYFSHEENDENRSAITCDTHYINTHPEQRSIIPPSVVATTTAFTEDIDARLHQMNMENPMYGNHVPVSGYQNNAYHDLAPSGPAGEFFTPNDPQLEDGIDEQFITINMDCYDQYKVGTSTTDQEEGNTQTDAPQTSQDNNLLDEEDLVDGRDV